MACSGCKSRISDAAYIREARRHRGHSWHSTHRWKAGRPRRRSDRPQRGRHTHWRPRRVAERRPRDRAGRAHEREGRRDAGALHAEQAHWRAARGQSSERAHRHARHRHPHAAVLFIKLLHVLLVVLLDIFPMLPAPDVLLSTGRGVMCKVHITIVTEITRHRCWRFLKYVGIAPATPGGCARGHRAGGEGRAFISQRRGGAGLLLRAAAANKTWECIQVLACRVDTQGAPTAFFCSAAASVHKHTRDQKRSGRCGSLLTALYGPGAGSSRGQLFGRRTRACGPQQGSSARAAGQPWRPRGPGSRSNRKGSQTDARREGSRRPWHHRP